MVRGLTDCAQRARVGSRMLKLEWLFMRARLWLLAANVLGLISDAANAATKSCAQRAEKLISRAQLDAGQPKR